MGIKKHIQVTSTCGMSKEHMANCRCGLMGVPKQHVSIKQPFVALLANVVQFLAKTTGFFAMFDRSMPDKTHLHVCSCLKLQFRLFLCRQMDRWTDGQNNYIYPLCMW